MEGTQLCFVDRVATAGSNHLREERRHLPMIGTILRVEWHEGHKSRQLVSGVSITHNLPLPDLLPGMLGASPPAGLDPRTPPNR